MLFCLSRFQSVVSLVVVILSEMATIVFLFLAHDKASNRNKNKFFDQNMQLLCEVAHFCINPVMLVMVGSFLCVSVILQVSFSKSSFISIFKNLVSNRSALFRCPAI